MWSGHIALAANGADERIEGENSASTVTPMLMLLVDVRLYVSQESSILQVHPGATLHFLSLVDAAALPFHLVSGPPLDVFTHSPSTEGWFRHNILDSCEVDGGEGCLEAPWWSRRCGQSSVGVLLRVKGDMLTSQNGRRVSELLIYAAIPRETRSDQVGMLTPPRSSSPAVDSELPENVSPSQVETARLYALPLSSEIKYHFSGTPGSQSPPGDDLAEGLGRFLSDHTVDEKAESSTQRKRQRLDSLFDDASQQRKRTKRRGGESVAKAIASLETGHTVNREDPTGAINSVESGSNSPAVIAPSKPVHPRNLGRSRTQSLGSLQDLDQSRPSSRSGITALKRSSLHRVASVGTFESSSPVLEAVNGIEQQNKTALARVVMAGMRMYGLQQKKKPYNPRAASEAPSGVPHNSTSAVTNEDEDEYKLVYHQTYKAVSFALRRQMSITGIGQNLMRAMVDQFLEIFCVDPIQKAQESKMSLEGFGTENHGEQNVFDSPSNMSGSQTSITCRFMRR